LHQIICVAVILAVIAMSQNRSKAQVKPHVPDSFNYVAGTQTIGAAYQFTKESRLVETAKAILDMGSNTIKFLLDAEQGVSPRPATLAEAAKRDPSVQAVLNMPFAHYLIWAYPISAPGGGPFDPARLASEKSEIYDLTRYLLTTFNRTGKSFYLGNWEGDWMLTRIDPANVPTEDEVQNMVNWANARQDAVDRAMRDTPHSDVNVYYYVEVNRVQDAKEGKVRVTNRVLPKINPDFVSYSSYDAQHGDIDKTFADSMDYIESMLKPKPSIPGKRVFIGEYGMPKVGNSADAQDKLVRAVTRAGLKWGCPFVLYWEMYNNEVTKDGEHRGFWLIDNHNEKQPAWHTLHDYYEHARAFVAEYKKRHGHAPDRGAFAAAAVDWLR